MISAGAIDRPRPAVLQWPVTRCQPHGTQQAAGSSGRPLSLEDSTYAYTYLGNLTASKTSSDLLGPADVIWTYLWINNCECYRPFSSLPVHQIDCIFFGSSPVLNCCSLFWTLLVVFIYFNSHLVFSRAFGLSVNVQYTLGVLRHT